MNPTHKLIAEAIKRVKSILMAGGSRNTCDVITQRIADILEEEAIKFTLRNEEGLHCRFCGGDEIDGITNNLFETSPPKGIVCEHCKEHLKDYFKQFNKTPTPK